MIADKDLISIQHARILAENAYTAQKKLATFTQEQLDRLVECIASEVEKYVQLLATLSHEETDFGRWQDKCYKNHFVCTQLPQQLRGMRCVGVIGEDPVTQVVDIGVPVGVVVALCPVTSPVSTTIYKTLLALKSGNAIIFSPHPRAVKCISTVLDKMIAIAEAHGLPKGCLSYLDTVTKSGTLELMQHRATALVMITGVPSMFEAARCVGKPIIYGGTGNGPVFIERTAHIAQAVQDIIQSKTFDHGIAPSAEQSMVVDASIASEVKQALQQQGAYFMSEAESIKLGALFFYADGKRRKDMVGKSATILAHRAGFTIPHNACLLVAERTHVSNTDPYSKELLAPVLAYYVEDDWMHACEKCLELLLHERNAHTLTIHSNDPEVIHQFALKKPVGRLLVNTPAAFGGMGASTALFPAMTLGSGMAGFGITTDNVSPLNLIYKRKVGYGIRTVHHTERNPNYPVQVPSPNTDTKVLNTLQKILLQAIKTLDEKESR